MDIKLVDKNIIHIPSFNGYDKPNNITWYRGNEYRDITVYTDRYLPLTHNMKNDSSIKVAWLMEPAVINTRGYTAIKQHHEYYDYIISHDLAFLDQFNIKKRVFCPGSGSSLFSHEWKMFPEKTKLVLTIVGNKKSAVGHKFRHEVAEKLGHLIDVIGRGYESFKPTERAIKYCPYMYQVAIHNTPVRDYWSDILIDCFATGTVPIVWEGHFLRKYFDMNGIICFSTLDELEEILKGLSEEDYLTRADAIKNNFQLAFNKYKVIEDYLYKTFLKKFE